MLAIDEPAFRRRFAGSPVLRAKRRGLARSAAIALGNHPDPPSFAALVAALADADAIVRAAAAWALGRWRRCGGELACHADEALRARRDRETDDGVVAEIASALEPHGAGAG